MGCTFCNLLELLTEHTGDKDIAEEYLDELANDIAVSHPELVSKIKVISEVLESESEEG